MNNHINNLLTNKSKLYSFVCRLSNAYCSACILGFFCCIIAFFKLMPFKMHHNISFIILEFLVLSFNLPEWLVTKHILGKNLEQLIININLISRCYIKHIPDWIKFHYNDLWLIFCRL